MKQSTHTQLVVLKDSLRQFLRLSMTTLHSFKANLRLDSVTAQ
jgi:hypothetical protein